MPTSSERRIAVEFTPWEGKSYQNGLGAARLLILGESHYGDADAHTPGLTKSVLDKHIEGTDKLRFFDRIEQVVGGSKLVTRDERDDFWQQVVFYNFVQELLPENRTGRAPKLWVEARAPFFDTVLPKFTPDAVLVLGVTTWNSLSSATEFFSSERVNTESPLFRWTLKKTGQTTLATWSRHPSARGGFKTATWRPRVEDLLTVARQLVK